MNRYHGETMYAMTLLHVTIRSLSGHISNNPWNVFLYCTFQYIMVYSVQEQCKQTSGKKQEWHALQAASIAELIMACHENNHVTL